jgi:hypothetical protein
MALRQSCAFKAPADAPGADSRPQERANGYAVGLQGAAVPHPKNCSSPFFAVPYQDVALPEQ